LQTFAATTPFEFTEITAASKRLLAFGVNAEDITKTLRSLGDVSSGIGAPIGEIAELYGKAKTQGRLFAEDINQLTGRGIPIIGELAKQFGVSESSVRGLVESGQVGFANLQTAFENMTASGSQFGGLMEAQSQTLPGMWSNMMDAIGQSSVVLGQELIKTFNLKEHLGNVIEALGNITALLQSEGLMGALDKVFNDKTKATIVLIAGGIVGALVPAIWAAVTAFGAAVVALAPFIAAGAAVAAMAYTIYKNWEPIKGFFTGIFDSISNGFETFKSGFVNGWENIRTSVTGIFRGLGNSVINAINGMINGLNNVSFSVPNWVPFMGGKSFGFNIPQIPAYAQGTSYVPETGLALIHKGEAVIPASENGKGKSVNITVELDGRVLLRALGQPLADTIRLKASAVI